MNAHRLAAQQQLPLLMNAPYAIFDTLSPVA
jgi:hypothetical protein